MECNKDDALKAKELAEEKLLKKDYGGARIFAMRARDLDPNLAGLRELLAAIEVNFSAERRINGQVDWYGVLGVQPLADDATIRRCYRKLARVLHPNKNKSVGAADAYKLITHAFSLLSDKLQRSFYDQNCNSWGKYEEIPGGKPSVPAYQIGFCNNNILNTPNYKDSDHMNGTPPIPTPVSPATLKQTFWTTCKSCGIQFEYHNVFVNCKLICFICRQPFLALEVLSPSVYRNESSTSRIAPMMEHNFNSNRIERNLHDLGRTPMYAVNSSLWPGHLSMHGGISSVLVPASSAAEAPGVYGMSSENLKRRYDDSTPVIREEGIVGKTHVGARNVSDSSSKSTCFRPNSVLIADSSRKIRRTDENQVHGDGRGIEAKIACQNGGIRFANEFKSRKDDAAGYCKRNGTRDAIMLMEMARKVIHQKLDQWKASSIPKKSQKDNNTDAQIRVNKERATSGVKHAAPELVDTETVGKKCFSADSKVTEFLTMSVADPDFHDFDGDRIENAFGKNEIWAVYDDDDGMPRFYALINRVISKKPFKMRISWLSSMTNDELAPIKWVSSGFAKTVGDLQIGRRDFSTSLNSFSHRVNWTKGSRGLIHIYPKKGDVWALYRNWSAEWNEFTKDEVVHKYDMVEVLDDYSEDRGINVAPLVKVAGFKTVFSRNADPGKFWNIPKAEMFRFSHQVPSYLLTGQEGRNAPCGCLELDPAATPMELLQTATEAAEEEMTTENPLADEPKPGVNSSEDAVELVPKKEVAKAMERKESCSEVKFVYKRRPPKK
ncbi:putative DnaJ domain-containing protein [Lupinus albus]|uniref:Putative DnaJ domain-containing protein n=1 Tax=Lupinus albus TaxID=3870 RepID=A0A6A4PRH6_LUPAL|nr:putative DnaJ domain-containing protein [Lupinus albus]